MHPVLVLLYLGAAVLAAGCVYFIKSQGAFTGNPGSRETSPSKGTPGGEIVLTGFFAPVGKLVGSVSPYTNKVETFFRFAGLPFRIENGSFASAPKGRLPWMKHGSDIVADSRFMIKYLQNTYGASLKVAEPQDAEARAVSTMIQRLCEEHMYFTSQYYRMISPKGTSWFKNILFRDLPPWKSTLTLYMFRYGRAKQLRYQGVLTNSAADIDVLIDEDLRALSGLLGNKPYFLGNQPTAADASAFGTLENYLYDGNEGAPIPSMTRKYPNLVRFVDSIRANFYAEKLSKQGKAQ